MLSDTCKAHLFSWRFQQASDSLARDRLARGRGIKPATDDEAALVRALARAYGDAVPFGGAMGEVVRAAVQHLLGPDYEGEIEYAFDSVSEKNASFPL